MTFVPLGKTIIIPCLVLKNAVLQTIGETDIQGSAFAGHDVHIKSVFPFHGSIGYKRQSTTKALAASRTFSSVFFHSDRAKPFGASGGIPNRFASPCQ